MDELFQLCQQLYFCLNDTYELYGSLLFSIVLGSCGYPVRRITDTLMTAVDVSWGTRRHLSNGPLYSGIVLSGSYRTLMVNDLQWRWWIAAGLEI